MNARRTERLNVNAAQNAQSTTHVVAKDKLGRQGLAKSALAAVMKTIADARKPEPGITHPLVKHFGEHLGMGLGVIVTEALTVVPSWNAPLRDANGGPVSHIKGADQIGEHPLRNRHQEVVGPKVEALVAGLDPGLVRDLVAGLGKGATAAPGTSYRLEARFLDLFK